MYTVGMCHPKGYGFWAYNNVFGLKTGIHFAYFGLELGMAFEGSMGFIISVPNE